MKELLLVGRNDEGGVAAAFTIVDPAESIDVAKDEGITDLVFEAGVDDERFHLVSRTMRQMNAGIIGSHDYKKLLIRLIDEAEKEDGEKEDGRVKKLFFGKEGRSYANNYDIVIVGLDRNADPDATYLYADPDNVQAAIDEYTAEYDLEVLFWVDSTDPRYHRLHKGLDTAVEADDLEGYCKLLQELVDEHYDSAKSSQDTIFAGTSAGSASQAPPTGPDLNTARLHTLETAANTLEVTVDELRHAAGRPVNLKINYYWLAAIAGVLAILPYVLATAAFRPPTPVYNAPDIHIDPNRIARELVSRAEYDPATGLYTALPPAADDEDVFRQACEDVCRADGRRARQELGNDPDIVPRVLANDPEHRICTCLTGHGVQRYVDWMRTR